MSTQTSSISLQATASMLNMQPLQKQILKVAMTFCSKAQKYSIRSKNAHMHMHKNPLSGLKTNKHSMSIFLFHFFLSLLFYFILSLYEEEA